LRRISKSLSGVAKTTVSKSKGHAMASSQWYSPVPLSQDDDLEEEEDEKEEEEVEEEEEEEEEEEDEEGEWSLKKKVYVAFPKSFGGGFLVDRKKETKISTVDKSSFGQGTHMDYVDYGTSSGKSNEQNTIKEEENKIPEYGGCNGCPGCIRCGCRGCSGGCRFCPGCCACQY